jgi:hypothetical protein
MTSLWSVIHVLNLAKRMTAQISVLLVIEPAVGSDDQRLQEKEESPIRTRLEKLIIEGRADGIPIDYYLAHGSYKNELIKFIQEKKISLLVLDSPLPGSDGASEKLPELLGEIKLRTHCRIEVVHRKDVNENGKRS